MGWTHTIEAVVDAETLQAKSQWRIGDAIKKDCETTESVVSPNFVECSQQLDEKGYVSYTPDYVGRLYRTAQAFKRSERDDRYSWDVHYMAGTPDNLKQAVSALRKLGKAIVQDNVRWLMAQWREKANEARRDENAAARAAEERAAKKQAEAAAKALKAKDAAARKAAKEEHRQALEEKRAAREQRKQTAQAPSYNENVQIELQDPSTLKAMAIYFAVTLHAKNMKKEAEKALKAIDQIAEHLTPVQIAEIRESYETVIELTRDIISKATGRPRLQVHRGGAA